MSIFSRHSGGDAIQPFRFEREWMHFIDKKFLSFPKTIRLNWLKSTRIEWSNGDNKMIESFYATLSFASDPFQPKMRD